jgi:hypothetical protein
MTRSYGDFEDMDDDEYESESEESGSESEDEEAPTAVPLQQNGKVRDKSLCGEVVKGGAPNLGGRRMLAGMYLLV